MSSILSNSMRVTGMVSGLDTDSIVSAMLLKQKAAVDKVDKDRKDAVLRLEKLQEVNKSINEFRNNYLSTLGSNPLNSLSTFKSFTLTKSGDTGAVSATASTSATGNAVTIDYVKQMAKSAGATGESVLWDDTPIKLTDKIADAMFAETAEFESNGTYDVVSFMINDEKFTFTDYTTIGGMMDAINNNSRAGVTMSFDATSGKFSIKSKTEGADSEVRIENLVGNMFGEEVYDDDGNRVESYGGVLGIAEGTYGGGQNAILSINGEEVEQSSNSFTVEGIDLQLKRVTEKSSTFETEADISKPLEAIKSFINSYNEMLDQLNSLLKETYYKDYRSLTDEERSGMTETMAAMWDEKSKSGLLRNDSNISRFLSKVRTEMVSAYFVGEKGGVSLSSIGISSKSYADLGKLSIDEEKLKKALTDNPDAVAGLFRGAEGGGGLSAKLTSAVSELSTKISVAVTSGLAKDLEYSKAHTEKLRKYQEAEDALYLKYANFETALQQLNSNGNDFSSLFGSLDSN